MVSCNHGKYKFRLSKNIYNSVQIEFILNEDGGTSYKMDKHFFN